MPIYEYNCSKCNHEFEVLIRSKSDLPRKCPKCGAQKPTKALSSFAVSSGSNMPCNSCPSGDMGCPSAGSGGCPSGGCGM